MAEATNGEVAMQEAVAAVKAPARREPPKPRIVPPVPIELDRVRHLRMDLRAMKLIEDKLGLVMWDFSAWDLKSSREAAVIFWACLLHEDPELTLEQVEVMPGMELANFPYLAYTLSLLWGFTMPESDEGDAPESTGPKELSSGSNSGPSDASTSDSQKKSSGA